MVTPGNTDCIVTSASAGIAIVGRPMSWGVPLFGNFELACHKVRAGTARFTFSLCRLIQMGSALLGKIEQRKENTRATTAYAEQTTVAAFLPWRGS